MIPIKRISELTPSEMDGLFNRFGEDFTSVMIDTVVPIVNDVKENGDGAMKKYTEKFDRVSLDSVLASEEELNAGYENTPAEVLDAFTRAKANIEEFHSRQKRDTIRYTRDDGTLLGVKYEAIERAAVYVPGGKAAYPSSVLMGVIPAKIAGTETVTLITPPNEHGRVPDIIGAMCVLTGVDRVIKSGGAHGIAAAGFGTETADKSDIIVGPGNIYVTAAKTYLFSLGIVQIDSMAGPSEVLIITDGSAPAKWVAWDFLSQAEHDEMAVPILVTTSETLAREVLEAVREDIDSGRGRHEIKKASVANNGLIILAESLGEAIDFSNRYGPEHMQLMVEDPLPHLEKIRNVGSLFLGNYSPVAVGDFYSGTNHILPTGGAARFSSGTSVETFLRRTTFQYLTEEGLKKAEGAVNAIARVEGFEDKHGGSVSIRFGD